MFCVVFTKLSKVSSQHFTLKKNPWRKEKVKMTKKLKVGWNTSSATLSGDGFVHASCKLFFLCVELSPILFLRHPDLLPSFVLGTPSLRLIGVSIFVFNKMKENQPTQLAWLFSCSFFSQLLIRLWHALLSFRSVQKSPACVAFSKLPRPCFTVVPNTPPSPNQHPVFSHVEADK